MGLKNEFETAELSVFEQLKVYCNSYGVSAESFLLSFGVSGTYSGKSNFCIFVLFPESHGVYFERKDIVRLGANSFLLS